MREILSDYSYDDLLRISKVQEVSSRGYFVCILGNDMSCLSM